MFDTVIIGGGPAGTGLLLKALKDGAENKFMQQQRIALFEKSSHLIKGNLTNYKVNSDTFSDVFLECLDGEMSQSIELETLKKEVEYIRNFKGKAIPLEELNHFFEKLGALLEQKLNQDPRFGLFMNTTVTRVVKLNTGSFKVFYNDNWIETKKIVLAAGAAPVSISGSSFAGKILLDPFLNKSIHSDDLIRGRIPTVLKSKLPARPKVVILGGSHSAFSAAHFLLNNSQVNFDESSIKIWCKTKPKIYFPDTADALMHGYFDFN
jgi:NADH dehydrogenase FAD-containing subunit